MVQKQGMWGNISDRALIDCHFEAGTRSREILYMQIKYVKFDKCGTILHVDDKTDVRPIMLVKSMPNLATWLSVHSHNDDPLALL